MPEAIQADTASETTDERTLRFGSVCPTHNGAGQLAIQSINFGHASHERSLHVWECQPGGDRALA